ncbi:MAG: class I SAM-dependent methyltransferase [Candidatus Dojkabacteria bacterium]|nr:class I SAM-dependent methyltransferase [Candidatus Dojkabacteria bacterium]
MNLYLYPQHAYYFSSTRSKPWRGWYKIIPYLSKFNNPYVIDFGCGNGRFLRFLNDNLKSFNYYGVDYSKTLLDITKNLSQKIKKNIKLFLIDLNTVDMQSFVKQIKCKFDCIVIFGLMHHLKTYNARLNIMKISSSILNDIGYIVVTWWKFLDFQKYKKKILIDLDYTNSFYNGDNSSPHSFEYNYIMKFGLNAQRFCHYCTDIEINNLIEQANLQIVEKFYSDGQDDKENLYTILTLYRQ